MDGKVFMHQHPDLQQASSHRTGKWANDCMSTSASCLNHCWLNLELVKWFYRRIIWPRNECPWWLFTEARCYWVLMGFLPVWKRHMDSADQSESEKKVACCLHLVFLHNFFCCSSDWTDPQVWKQSKMLVSGRVWGPQSPPIHIWLGVIPHLSLSRFFQSSIYFWLSN